MTVVRVEEGEPEFPIYELSELDKKISCPRWVVPVLPEQELEKLLIASIELARKGLDIRSEPCQRFIRDGLTISFTKILTDDAVNSWKQNIHQYIYSNCKLLVELCVVKIDQDWFPLLDLLAMLFNPNNKFHTFNSQREPTSLQGSEDEDERFARVVGDNNRSPRGWLVDLIQQFGKLGGFAALRQRFVSPNAPALNVTTIFALLRPFGLCCDFLTVRTITDYLLPAITKVMEVLEGLTDEELKKEAKNESKNDAIASIIKGAKNLVSRIPEQEDTFKQLEMFRLKIILRLLQISSFNGKMSALNEVNKMIGNVSYNIHRNPSMEEEEWLTSERMVRWIKENHVLEIVLRDSLHQPQYVDKLEKMLRFIIKERALTLEDLDHVWAAQAGKHEAIVKNVHDLLAKLAWDFAPQQLDHLFVCFQSSWATASKKQQEKLLELIRRLAEDDKEGMMANKVLNLFWNLAHSDDVTTDVMDLVLSAHVKILDYSCSQDRDVQKNSWLDRCVEELKKDNWVLPALKQIREICSLYEQGPNISHPQRANQLQHRQEVIDGLQKKYSLVVLISENIEEYMAKVREYAKIQPGLESHTFFPDKRYSHEQQVQERLNFLRFLLKDGQLWLCSDQAKQIWQCMAERAVFPSDREACFKWFSKLMGEEPDLDPSINKGFFEENILQLDPSLLTESGIKCFERFFKSVNKMEKKLIQKRRTLVMDDPDLIGMEYLWRVISMATEDIANRAIEIIKEVTTNLGPRLTADLFHDTFMSECLDRLRTHYDNVSMLYKQDLEKELESPESQRLLARLETEAIRICRVMKVLQEYVSECDNDFPLERSILPLYRACRGKNITLSVRCMTHVRQADDLEIHTHSNETLASLKRSILGRIKGIAYSGKLEVSVMNSDGREPFVLTDDKKLLCELRVRDKMVMAAKLLPAGSTQASSPDSSSDSSTSCPHHSYSSSQLPNEHVEASLPGVMLSRKGCSKFFTELSDLGCELRYAPLRDGARMLLMLIPPDSETVLQLQNVMLDDSASLQPLFFSDSPTQVLYHTEVLYALLMPAADPLAPAATQFQYHFIRNGHASIVVDCLTKDSFLSKADVATKRTTYASMLKMCKLLLTIVGHVVSMDQNNEEDMCNLQRGLRDVISQAVEPMLRNVAHKVAPLLADELAALIEGPARSIMYPAMSWSLPSTEAVRAILRLAWAASTGSLEIAGNVAFLREAARRGDLPEPEDVTVAQEALQLLTLAIAMHPSAFDELLSDELWHGFVIDLVLLANHRAVRMTASDQMLLMAALSASAKEPLLITITLLYDQLTTTVMENSAFCFEYFNLLGKLISYARIAKCPLPDLDRLLSQEIAWLRTLPAQRGSDRPVDELVLEGRLNLARELLCFTTPEQKYDLGSNEAVGGCLVKELVEDFIFPASKQMVTLAKYRELTTEPLVAVCSTDATINAAFQLLFTLCADCVYNKKILVDMLTEMFYSDREKPLAEWDYLPTLGPRPMRGFVGLKNAGATCYMNSVLQQLFMVESIRCGVLAAEGAAPADNNEDLSNDPEGELEGMDLEPSNNKPESRKDYNIGILKQVQMIFGHLACSHLQYYTPQGLWRQFRLQGEPVNLREQQDAVEFFMSLVESVDEALKALGQEQIMTKILGGSYSDQKICKGCPHRYAKEEPFSVISVDIRNHSNLLDSLEQYVKGELLEGADAYHCDNCNKKRETVKRLCVKKLPPVLAIQLKRFEYDFDRVCAIKFNDYFEFPRDLDMDPYTVSGLAKLEGELIDCDAEEAAKETCTKYQLSGIVVHSGQASGGHYYSFILHRLADGTCKWYKFDDGEVSELKMDEDEEMKNQCFGGEYMGEVFDNAMKRTSYRRQKRWWNAYMLYYTRLDAINPCDNRPPKMPAAIERGVRRQNIYFLHNRNQFCPEYFLFIRTLLKCIPQSRKLASEEEESSLLSVQLASRFLFHTGFHTKKALRGVATEWFELLIAHLHLSANVRRWFAFNILFKTPQRFAEYLLGSAPNDVRTAFMKILMYLAHFTHQDLYSPPLINARSFLSDPDASLSDHIIKALLLLLEKELNEHGRCLVNFFSLLQGYVMLGFQERAQLLKLRGAETLITVGLEGPDPSDKYQYQEWAKLHQTVSMLVRCCDITSLCHSSEDQAPMPNPYVPLELNQYLMPLPQPVVELIFAKNAYLKKLVEDPTPSDEVIKMVQFCSWENLRFSRDVILECVSQISYHCQDIKHFLDLLLHVLCMEDSWQPQRIGLALIGHCGSERPEQKRGLLDVIVKTKSEYPKRAYQCIKVLTTLFTKCPAASPLLTIAEVKTKWVHCIDWLQEELDRRPSYATNQYNYSNWSPLTASNETSNGYYLERSNSAKKLLEMALELCPKEEAEEEAVEGDVRESAGDGAPDVPAPANLVNTNKSFQSPDSRPDHIKNVNLAPPGPPLEEGSSNSDKVNMSAFESGVANLCIEQSK